jgi:uncharacterized protein YchJ
LQQVVKEVAQNARFFKLQVLGKDEGKEAEGEAFVEFRVWYKLIGPKASGSQVAKAPMQTMTERSRFEKESGRWMFIETVSLDQKPHPYPEG